MLRAFSCTLFTILISNAFALPGDSINEMLRNPNHVYTCSLNKNETISKFSLKSLGNLVGCHSFKSDQYIEYCDCMKDLYADSITKNKHYKEFKSKVQTFDRQETNVETFTNDTEVKQLAALANAISQKLPAGTGAFVEGGACKNAFDSNKVDMDKRSDVPQKFDVLNRILQDFKQENYLMANGITDEFLDKELRHSFLIKENNGATEVFLKEKNNNKLLKLLEESVGKIDGKKRVKNRIQRIDSKSSEGVEIGVPFESILANVCKNLVKRFESLRNSKYSMLAPQNGRISIAGNISYKELHISDMKAFRGLRARFKNEGVIPNDGQDLFFGQMMCSRLKNDSFNKKTKGSTDSRAKGLDKVKLKMKIEAQRSVIEGSLAEYNALEGRRFDLGKVQKESVKKVFEILGHLNISKDSFWEAYKSAKSSEELEKVMQNLLEGKNISSLSREEFQTAVRNYHTSASEFEQLFVDLDDHADVLDKLNILNNEYFKELAFLVGGDVNAHAFLGKEISRSDSTTFFERFYNYGNDNGPQLPISERINGRDKANIVKSEERDAKNKQNLAAAMKNIQNDKSLTDEEKENFKSVLASVKVQNHSKKRVESFISGEDSAISNDRGTKDSLKENIQSEISEMTPIAPVGELVEKPAGNYVREADADEATDSGFTKPVDTRAVDTRAVTSNQEIPYQKMSDYSQISDTQEEELSTIADERIDRLTENVEAKIEAAQKTGAPASENKRLERIRGEVQDLKAKVIQRKAIAEKNIRPVQSSNGVATSARNARNARNARTFNNNSQVAGTAAGQVQDLRTSSGGSQNSGSSSGNTSTVSVGGSNKNSQSVSSLINFALNSLDKAEESNTQLDFFDYRDVSSVDNKELITNVDENFFALSNDEKLTFLKNFFSDKKMKKAYIKSNGRLILVKLKEEASSVGANSLRAIIRVEQLSKLLGNTIGDEPS